MKSTGKFAPSSVRLGMELDREVDRLSEELGMPRSQIVRKAVSMFVARQNHIESVLIAARESERQYLSTGRGISWEDAETWMRQGGKGTALPPVTDMRG